MTNPPKKTQKQDPNQADGDQPQRRLLRSPGERMLAGVAGGTARYLGVDPTFVRLGFVVAAFFGGLGILAYLVMAVVVPEDDGSGKPVEGQRPPTWAIVLLGLTVLILLPGPFGGWSDGWFGAVALFWLAVVLLVGAGAYRALTGRWPGQQRGPGTDVAGRADAPGRSRAASEATTAVAPHGGADGAPPRIVRLLVIGLIALCAISAAISVAAIGAWATATGNGEVVAGIVVALGVAIAATAAFGGAARRGAPWLLALALALAIPAGAVAAADVRFDGGIGERDHSPTAVAEIPAGGYELGIGQLKVDLRELVWKPGEVVELPAELGIGQLIVSVPSDVCVVGHAEAAAGELLVRGSSNSGTSAEFDRGPPAPAAPAVLDLDVELQLGQLVVTDRDPDAYDGEGPDRHGEGGELAAEPAACAR